MASEIKIDDKQFQEALNLYLQYNKRDMPLLLNKIAKDICFMTSHDLLSFQAGTIQKITAIVESFNFLKMVSHRLAIGELKAKQKRNRKGEKSDYAWQKRISNTLKREKAKRLRSVTLMASGFVKAGKAFQDASGLAYIKSGLDAAKGWGRGATQTDNPQAVIGVSYNVKNKAGAIDWSYEHLLEAMDAKALDMMIYVKRKIAENGKKVSGRGV